MTLDDYNELYRKQEGRCAICREPFARLDVDHDHETNMVRGLLCGACNRGLGHFADNIARLVAAIEPHGS